jgi:signal transduction histidine kinase
LFDEVHCTNTILQNMQNRAIRFFIILFLNSFISSGQLYHNSLSSDSLLQILQNPHLSKTSSAYLQTINHLSTKYNTEGLFDSSLVYSRTALKLANNLNLLNSKASALFNIGYALQKKELYFEAVKNFEEAIKVAERARNDSLLAISYHYAAMSYLDQKNTTRCMLSLQKELVVCKKARLNFQTSACYNSLGRYYFIIYKFDSALYYFSECLKNSSQFRFDILMASSCKNVGKCYLSLGKEKEGVSYIKRSIGLFLNGIDKETQSDVIYSYSALAQHYQCKKDFKLSNYYALLGYKINLRANFTDMQLEFCQILYQNYQSIGHYKEAFQYLDNYQKYSNKISNDLLTEQKIAIEERFKSQNQEVQIELLNNQNIIKDNERKSLITGLLLSILFLLFAFYLYRTIKKQKSEIEAINQNLEGKVQERTQELQHAYDEIKEAMLNGQTIERKRVAAELHDNLGSILSAIGMSMEVLDESKLDLNEGLIFGQIKRQIHVAYQEVRLLSHNLQPEELENKGLKNALQTLQSRINVNAKIKLQLNLEHLKSFPKEVEFNLYTICLELINNTIRHSGATQAKIFFAETENSKQIMQYSDNGNGYDENQKEGFGLQSIKNRVQQIGGTINIQEIDGLVFDFVF